MAFDRLGIAKFNDFYNLYLNQLMRMDNEGIHSGTNIQKQQISQESKQALTDYESLPLRRINADDHKKWVLLSYIGTMVVFIIFTSLISAYALPSSLTYPHHIRMREQSGCKPMVQNGFVVCAPSQIKANYDGFFINDITKLNQYVFFYLQNQDKNQSINLDENVKCSLYVADELPEDTNSSQLKVKLGDLIQQNYVHLEENSMRGQRYKSNLMLFLTKLGSSDKFYWQLQLINSTNIKQGSYYPYATVIQPRFTIFTIILRVVLFVISLAAFIKYNQKIFKLKEKRVSIQQKLIRVLSIFTLMFNDQFYPISVLAPNPFSSFLSTFFIWNFVSFLFFLWIYFLERIKTEDSNAKIVTIPFVLLFTIFYAMVLAYSTAYAVSQLGDRPVFSYEDINSSTVKALSVIAFIVFIISCLYILYLYVYILRYKENRLYRHKVFMNISFFFFVSTIVFFFLGGYNIFSYSASKIYFTFSFMNLYSLGLQFLYYPAQSSQYIDQCYIPYPRFIQNPKTEEVQIQLSESNHHESNVNKSNHQDQGRLSARQKRRKRKRKEKQTHLSNSQDVMRSVQEKFSAQLNPIQIQID